MMQTALEEATTDGEAAKGLLQKERESTALLSKARAAAIEVHSEHGCCFTGILLQLLAAITAPS